MTTSFDIRVLGCQTWNINDDNVDVEIVVDGLGRYAGTFFTLQNIATLFEKNQQTGECASGIYLWAANMIIVRDLRTETIRQTVEDLWRTGELEAVCHRIE